ncbi:MAG: helix-turn-helix domain-containing protein [Leptospirales bacterium]
MGKRSIDEQALFHEALEEFSQHSYEEASINKILSKAKVTKGSFYYRFSNKFELYIYLLKECNQRKWQYIQTETKTDTNPKEAKDIFDLFWVQAEIGVRFANAHPVYYKLGKRFSKEKGTAIYEQVLEDLKADDESGLSQMIEESYQAGAFKSEYSPEFIDKLIRSLFSSFDDILFKDEEFELTKAMEYLKEFILFLKHGLKA